MSDITRCAGIPTGTGVLVGDGYKGITKDKPPKAIIWHISEYDYRQLQLKIRTDDDMDGYFLGKIRIGELCFELEINISDEDGVGYIDYDCYVGGVPNSYGKTTADYPYDKICGDSICTINDLSMSYAEFKRITERCLREFIARSEVTQAEWVADENLPRPQYTLQAKAAMPLHEW